MTENTGQHHNGSGRYVIKRMSRAQKKAAEMLLAREEQGLSSPSEKARALAEAEPTDPGDTP